LALTEESNPRGGKIRLTLEAQILDGKKFKRLSWAVNLARTPERKVAALLNQRDMKMRLSVTSEIILETPGVVPQ
jgi:hypothetical protein